MDQTPRRNVRRKLVQSSLLPHKPEDVIDSNGDPMCDEGGEVGDGRSQGKKTRKQKERTPKNGATKKVAKGKSPRKTTPKKCATKNGIVAAGDQMIAANVSPPVPNLRLEAKLRAEENSRMSAGKQIHPFFSTWKGGKRNQEAVAAENGTCLGRGRDKIVTIGPIHVFDKFQDDYPTTLDWKNWTFYEQTSTTESPDQQIKFNSLEPRPKEFDLNELPSLSHPDVCVIDDEEPEQCTSQSEGIAEASSVVLIEDQEEKRGCLGFLDGAESDCEVHEAINLSDDAGGEANISHEMQHLSCRESNDSSGQPCNRLWVDKYQPRSASEVCGNTESVKVMNEWLRQWYERGFQPNKDFLSSDEDKSQDADYNCSESDSDSEKSGAEDSQKNVLLIVGPAGSGKSAAIHACAKEQGFKILESNTSECRSGTVVRQKFGEALKSYSLSRSLDPLFNSCTDGNGVEDVVEVMPVLHIQNDGANLKPLILFEDVDICFAEDRGLVSAIQQIAVKAKGPVVLTANDKNHGLPDNLERIEIYFSLPSKEELFNHLSLVCAAEEVKVNHGSLEEMTTFCGGDIRKAIMQLQFWFQSKPKRARKVKNTGNQDLFDHEAGHLLLPKIIARDFPSQLSQLVENEIAKVLSMEEERNNTVEVFVEEVENEKMLNRLWRRGTGKNSIQAKKAAMFRQNTTFEDYDELEDVLRIPCELSNTSYQPLSFSQPNRRRKLNVVMSSDSEDEPLTDIRVSISQHQKDDRLIFQEDGTLSSYWPDMQKETNPLADPSRAEILEAACYQYETSKFSYINEVSQSVEISCVPESSYVPETLMDGEAELSPRAVSCGHFDGRVEVSMNEDVVQTPPSKEIYIDRFQIFDCLKNTSEIIAESSDATVMEDCFKEYVGAAQKMQQVSDECSRMDFGKTYKTAEKPKLDTSRSAVQESWEKICSNLADFKPYLDSEPVEAPQVLDLTHQITNLFNVLFTGREREFAVVMAPHSLKKNYRCSRSLKQFYGGGPFIVSSDGSFIACACGDVINIVDSTDSSVKSTIEGESDTLTALALSPDDKLLFSAGHSRQIRVWDLETLKCIRSWKGHEGPVMGMACHASGGLLATAGADRKVLVWDVDGGFCTHYFRGHKGVVSSILFHPDSNKNILISGSDDATVRVWDLNAKNTEKKCLAIMEKHFSAVTSIALSEDGLTLFSAGRDKVVNLWDLHDYSCKATVATYEVLEAVTTVSSGTPFASFVASLDQKKSKKKESDSQATYFITVGERGVVRIWKSEGSICLYEQKSSDITVSSDDEESKRGFTAAAMLPSDHGLLCVTADQQFFFYSVVENVEETELVLSKRLVGYNEEIADMKFLGDEEQFLAVATNLEEVRVYDVATMSCSYVLAGHKEVVLSLDTCVSSSGNVLIVTGSKDKTVRLWNATSKSCIGVGTGHNGDILAVAFAKKSFSFFVSGSGDRTLKVWSLDGISEDSEEPINLKTRSVVAAHDKDINSVAVARNDSLVCTGSEDRTASIWRLPDLVHVVTLKGHKRRIFSVEFSTVDQCVMTASGDKTVKIWAISDGSCLKTFEGHTSSVLRASFITDGTQFVSCGADGLLKLWNVNTSECIATYDQHEDKVWALAVGKKTEMIATGGGDAVINLWHDSTASDKEDDFRKEEEAILRGQELENAVLDAEYTKAIRLAFELCRPHKVFELFSGLCRKRDSDEQIVKALQGLEKEEFRLLFEYVREWNTKPKLCHIAQFVLYKTFNILPPTEIVQVKGIGELLEGLIPYSQRHFSRIDRFVRSSFLLDYTLGEMSVIDPETVETEYPKDEKKKEKDVIAAMEQDTDELKQETPSRKRKSQKSKGKSNKKRLIAEAQGSVIAV